MGKEITIDERYNSVRIPLELTENETLIHYSYFLMVHGEKLRELCSKYSEDYYSDAEYLVELFNYGVEAWAKEFDERKIGLSDYVGEEFFLVFALEEMRNDNMFNKASIFNNN